MRLWRRKNTDQEEGLRIAQERLAEVRDQWPEVRDAAARMREHKRRNNFAQAIANVYRSSP